MFKKNKEHITNKLNELGMNQKELAEKLELTPVAISKFISGKNSLSMDNLIALSELFDVTIDWLMKGPTDNNKKMDIFELEVKAGKDILTLDSVKEIKKIRSADTIIAAIKNSKFSEEVNEYFEEYQHDDEAMEGLQESIAEHKNELLKAAKKYGVLSIFKNTDNNGRKLNSTFGATAPQGMLPYWCSVYKSERQRKWVIQNHNVYNSATLLNDFDFFRSTNNVEDILWCANHLFENSWAKASYFLNTEFDMNDFIDQITNNEHNILSKSELSFIRKSFVPWFISNKTGIINQAERAGEEYITKAESYIQAFENLVEFYETGYDAISSDLSTILPTKPNTVLNFLEKYTILDPDTKKLYFKDEESVTTQLEELLKTPQTGYNRRANINKNSFTKESLTDPKNDAYMRYSAGNSWLLHLYKKVFDEYNDDSFTSTLIEGIPEKEIGHYQDVHVFLKKNPRDRHNPNQVSYSKTNYNYKQFAAWTFIKKNELDKLDRILKYFSPAEKAMMMLAIGDDDIDSFKVLMDNNIKPEFSPIKKLDISIIYSRMIYKLLSI